MDSYVQKMGYLADGKQFQANSPPLEVVFWVLGLLSAIKSTFRLSIVTVRE